jgi:hypothetical protein
MVIAEGRTPAVGAERIEHRQVPEGRDIVTAQTQLQPQPPARLTVERRVEGQTLASR